MVKGFWKHEDASNKWIFLYDNHGNPKNIKRHDKKILVEKKSKWTILILYITGF